MKGNIFSPEDKEFMEIVQSDLQRYLQKNIFPSRTVLVFPPFNGFRRFLIHKLIEDNFASSEVAAFSIGQDIGRRIVVCYKGLISEAAKKGLPATIPQPPKQNMIDKEKPIRQRQTPTVAVYRPPAARQAENRKSKDSSKPVDNKQTRVRRPDQQMYVPRPKRASYDNDLPSSRSRSNSRLSLDSDQSSDVKKNLPVNNEELNTLKHDVITKHQNGESILTQSSIAEAVFSSKNDIEKIQSSSEINVTSNCSCEDVSSLYASKTSVGNTISKKCETNENDLGEKRDSAENENQEVVNVNKCKNADSNVIEDGEMQVDGLHEENSTVCKEANNEMSNLNTSSLSSEKKSIDNEEENITTSKKSTPNETIETISISSESKSEDSNSSVTSSSDSKTSDSSVDHSEDVSCKNESSEKMDIDGRVTKNPVKKSRSESKCKEEESTTGKSKLKAGNSSTPKISEVMVISDTSSSDDSMKSVDSEMEKSTNLETSGRQLPSKTQDFHAKNSEKQKVIDPNECDWESLYDDRGECLVPSLMEELTKSVGRVKVTSTDNDYRPYQSIEERTNDGECVIEIYDFPAEFKTTDLFNVFAAYRNKNFQIKWVDDTHALGVFPSPLMADEVLACTLPFVKTRPLRLAITESRNKARNLILPPLPSVERPKTCPALARRLVTGALGLRIPTSSQEREKEKQVLKEAREKRRLEAKQREAAWEGTITSGSAI